MAASAKPRPTIYYIRHGETDWNVAGRLQGRARHAAQCARPRPGGSLRRNSARPVRARRPRSRRLRLCFQPARPRARDHGIGAGPTLGLPADGYGVDQRLAEISFGDWEGFTIAQLHERDPQRIAQREHDKWHFVPPGGESYKRVSERMGGWYDEPHARHGRRPPMAAPRAG